MATAATRVSILTPLGPVTLTADGAAVTALDLEPTRVVEERPVGILAEACAQLEAYFGGRLRRFSVPLGRPADATPFQERVWDALLTIPFGQTLTYGQLAGRLGSSARAVGGACRRNPLPLFVPCHRVVAARGLGGYSGDWETGKAVRLKRALLDHEAQVAAAGR